MKEALTIEQVYGKMTWLEVVQYYKPEATEKEAEHILWEHTCYPFSDETTLRQITHLLNSEQEHQRSVATKMPNDTNPDNQNNF